MARRRTEALLRVALVMLNDPSGGPYYGYGLMQSAHVLSGTLYPILDKMLRDGWLTDEWDVDESTGKQRRNYILTDLGRRELGGLAADARNDRRFAWLFTKPAVQA